MTKNQIRAAAVAIIRSRDQRTLEAMIERYENIERQAKYLLAAVRSREIAAYAQELSDALGKGAK